MAHIPTLFDENQQLDESEKVDSLANKSKRIHNAMLILQGFNPKTGYLETFVEHCEQANTKDNIAIANFYASDKYRYTKRHKKRSKFKEHEDNGKKYCKQILTLLISPW